MLRIVLPYDLVALNDPAEAVERCAGPFPLIRPYTLRLTVVPYELVALKDPAEAAEYCLVLLSLIRPYTLRVRNVDGREERCCSILYSHQDSRFDLFRREFSELKRLMLNKPI